MHGNRIVPLIGVAICAAWFAWDRWSTEDTELAASRATSVLANEPQSTASTQHAVVSDPDARRAVEPDARATALAEEQNSNEIAFRILHPDATPAVSIEVRLDNRGMVREYVSDSDGVVRMAREHFADGWRITAQDGDCAASGDLTARNFPSGLRAEHDLPLYGIVPVRGRVIDHTGRPLAKAKVGAAVQAARPFVGLPSARKNIAVDDEGRFECRVEACNSPWIFTARAPGHASATEQVTITADTTAEILLRCAEGGILNGLVVDGNENPIRGANVFLEPGGPSELNALEISLTTTQTDDAGSFRFLIREAGEWKVHATADDSCDSDPVTLEVGVAQTVFATLQCRAPNAISGTVVWEDGRPAIGASVAAGSESAAVHRGTSIRTDDQGRFELSKIRSGAETYTLTCAPDPNLRERAVSLSGVLPGKQDVRIVLSEVALDAALSAFGELEVGAYYADTGERLRSGSWSLYKRRLGESWSVPETRTYDNGIARMQALIPGVEYCGFVDPHREGYLAALIEPFIASDGLHSFEISSPRAERVELAVLTSSDGLRAARATVTALDPHPGESRVYSAVVRENGTASFLLRPGRYRANLGGAEPLEYEFEVRQSSNGASLPTSAPHGR